MSRYGKITRVIVDDEEKQVNVDVAVSPTLVYPSISFRTPASDVWVVPEEGDIVEVTMADDREAVAHSPLAKSDTPMPSGLGEGDVSISLSEDVQLSLIKQDDGSYNIDIVTDGDLQLDAANILVGEDGQRKQVLTEDAQFEYEQRVDTDDGSGGTTTQTTTTVSNGEVTDTEVE